MDEKKKKLLRAAGMGEEVSAVECGMCPTCGTPICKDEFRDALSRKEFEISGMCMACQNEVFGKGGD